MDKLADTVAFNEADHPELLAIFRSIDSAVAALVASDPSFRRKARLRRRTSASSRGNGQGRGRTGPHDIAA